MDALSKTQGAVKVHTLLNPRGSIPEFILISGFRYTP